jgi:hypothetical protein
VEGPEAFGVGSYQDHEDVVVVWEDQQLRVWGPVRGWVYVLVPKVGVVHVAFCPPGATVAVGERQFADQVREAWFGRGGGAQEGNRRPGDRRPVDEAAADVCVEEEHA